MSDRLNEQRVCEAARVTWHTSEEGGLPDVGISLGLGGKRMLWAGEITDDAHAEAGDEAERLGPPRGFWLIIYDGPSRQVIGRCTSAEAAQDLMDSISALVAAERSPPASR
jgi:hypothetical protein